MFWLRNYDYDYPNNFFIRLRLYNLLRNQRGNRLCNRCDYTSLNLNISHEIHETNISLKVHKFSMN